ncbi:hypothetical protein X762_31485 [Mesorhizobium sp. LSHC426A00]|nr:hypothetical protein X762_31485 [Mesorhizobium sp. LSHC426A00]ESX43419.1 hypothetical protein X761_33145 [Mesorhizobium sp. LSHC424B00]ESX63898.1 hypothetical protein X758_32860 [Mesorhizobium sp. LSHC416B00]
MLSAQITFLADGKLDVLGNEINTVSQLNQLRIGRARNTWIDFNNDRASLGPPEFNVRWSPAKAESSQTAQRDVGDTFIVVIIQRGRKGEFTKDEIGWGAELGGTNRKDVISHYISNVERTLCELFDQYPRRRLPYMLAA